MSLRIFQTVSLRIIQQCLATKPYLPEPAGRHAVAGRETRAGARGHVPEQEDDLPLGQGQLQLGQGPPHVAAESGRVPGVLTADREPPALLISQSVLSGIYASELCEVIVGDLS